MIGCPSHLAPLGLMVFRPGMGGRQEQGGGGEQGWTGRKFLLRSVCSICARRTLWPDRGTSARGPGSHCIQLSTD